MSTVLLLGATGGSGKNILRLLTQDENKYKVTILVRNIQKAKESLTTGDSCISEEKLNKVAMVQGSLTDSKYPDIFDVDYIIHSAATKAATSSDNKEYEVVYLGMKRIIQEAKKSKKLKKIIYITCGWLTKAFHPITIFLNIKNSMAMKWKLESENELRESGLPYVICRPSGSLIDEPLESAPVEFGQGDNFGVDKLSRVSVGECVLKCVEFDIVNTTFEMINNSKKPKTDWSELNQLKEDKQKTIHANHHLPFYIFFLFVILLLGFILVQFRT
jgi:hypothetical protein